MNQDEKLAEMAETEYLEIAIKTVRIILSEYRYKYWNDKPIRFDVSRGRLESQGIYINDVEHVFLKYFSSDHTLKNATIRVENNFILGSNTKFMWELIKNGVREEDKYFNEMMKTFYTINSQKYADVLSILFVPPYTFQDLLTRYNDLLDLANQKNLLMQKDITRYIFWEDEHILKIRIPGEGNYRQINFSPTKRRFPENIYHFTRGLIKLVSENYKVYDDKIEAVVNKSDLLKEMKTFGNKDYDLRSVDNTKSNFFNQRLSEDITAYFKLGDYQKSLKGYIFTLKITK